MKTEHIHAYRIHDKWLILENFQSGGLMWRIVGGHRGQKFAQGGI